MGDVEPREDRLGRLERVSLVIAAVSWVAQGQVAAGLASGFRE